MRTAAEIVKRLQEHLESGVLDPNMPMFVLWATDMCASDTVRYWADYASEIRSPQEKVGNAYEIADAMDAWPVQRVPGIINKE